MKIELLCLLRLRPMLFGLFLIAGLTRLGLQPAEGQQVTNGFLNQFRSEAPGTLLSHPDDNDSWNIGRTSNVQYLRGWVIVGAEGPGSRDGSDREMRVYDIEDPANPIRMFPSDFGLSYSGNSWHSGNFGFNTHGTAQSGAYLWPDSIRVLDWGGVVESPGQSIPYRYPRVNQANPFGGFNRSSMAGPWYATMNWYNNTSSQFDIVKSIPDGGGFTDKTLATLNHPAQFGGGNWHPMFFGDLLIYARSNDNANSNGIVVYRLTYNNFDNPATMSVTPSFVAALPTTFEGYWPNLYGNSQGGLYVVGADRNILMAADITNAVDPSTPGNDMSLARTYTEFPGYPNVFTNASYPIYKDNYAFIHRYKFDMDKFVAGDNDFIALELDEIGTGVNTSQMSLPLGNIWITGGIDVAASDQGMGVWVSEQAPDTKAPKVGYHIPQAGRVNYPRYAPLSFLIHEVPAFGGPIPGQDFTVRRVNGDGSLGTSISGQAIHDMSGVLTFTPDVGLDADATYEVEFLSDPVNGNGFVDAAGNYIEAYSFRFSTGSSIIDTDIPEITELSSTNLQAEPGDSVSINVTASGTGLEYRFRFEAAWTDWQTSSSASHVFTSEGRYRVDVEVRGSSGTVVNDSVQVLVIDFPAGPLPTHSSTLAVGDDGGSRRVWSVNTDAGTVTVIDADSGAKVNEHFVGTRPRSITRDGFGRYWVACQGDDLLVCLNPDGTVADVVDTGYGSGPFGVVASPDGGNLYVSLYSSGQLLRLDTTDITAMPEIVDTFSTPRAIAVSGDGTRVLVTRFISNDSYGEVAEFASDPSGLSYVRTFELAYSSLIDDPEGGAGLPNYLAGIAISPDGNHALVMSKQDNVTRGEAFGRAAFTHDNTVRAILSVLDLNSNQEILSARQDFDNAEGPYAVTFSPLGDLAFVTLQGTNRILGIDTFDLENPTANVVAPIVSNTSGLAPQGVLLDPLSKRAFTQNFTGRSVSVFDATGFIDRNETALPTIVETAAVANEPFTAEELDGLRIFYNASDPRMSAEGYMSCASCHIEGGHDGRVWDFTERGEGLRRTIDLRGRAGLGHGNVHWSGNFDEIQDFEHDIRGPFGGLGFLELTPSEFAQQHPDPSSQKSGLNADLDALTTYVSSLQAQDVPRSPYREIDGTLVPEADSGRQLFAAMNCIECHSGSDLTDSQISQIASAQLRDVGTTATFSGDRSGQGPLSGVDTPTLFGLHASRAYLHHGQASTLEEVFSFAGGDFLDAASSEIGTITTGAAPSVGGGGDERGMFYNTYLSLAPGEVGRWSGIEGGQGGTARISVRYSRASAASDTVRVNGVDHSLAVVGTSSSNPATGPNAWEWASIEAPLAANASNVIEYIASGGASTSVDGIMVANADQLSAAATHRQVLGLSASERSDLMTYLLSLDGSAGESPPVPVPNAPSGLAAVATNYESIDLTWSDLSSNEAGFRVERDSGSGFALIAELAAESTSYTDAGLSENTQYTYRLLAFNEGGVSTYSSTASATTPSAPNLPPVVDAGADATITLPAGSYGLNGSVTDPNSGDTITVAWSGPAGVSFADSNSAATTATFAGEGVYTLTLTAEDGVNAPVSDSLIVTVNAAPTAVTVDFESLTVGVSEPSPLVINGFQFVESAGDPFQVEGTNRGYESTVILNAQFAESILVSKTDGGNFDLASFDYSGAPFGENITDATVIGTFVGGATQSVTYTTTSRVGQTLALDWTDLTSVEIVFSGGDNSRYGGVDNFVFGSSAPANTPPTVDAGADQTITLPTNGVSLSGSVSDAEDTPTVSWSGPAGVSFSDASSVGTTATFTADGVYTLTLTADDGVNTPVSDSVVVTVNPAPNASPTVEAGADQTITLPTDSVSLSGSVSDAEDTPTVSWSGPSGVSFADASSAATMATFATDGVYTLTLTADDGVNAPVFDSVVVTVNPEPSASVTIDFESLSQDSTATEPLTLDGFVFTDGLGEDFVTAGTAKGYDSVVILNNSWDSTITITKSGSGSFDLESFDYSTARWGSNLTDANVVGTFADSSTQTVTYSTTSRVGQTLTLNWTGLTQVVIDFAAGSNGRHGGVDNFVFGSGSSSNSAPTVNAGADDAITLPNNTYALNGSASDPDGDTLTTTWSDPNAAGVGFDDASSLTATATFPSAGTYTLRLTADDGVNASVTDDVVITVNPDPNAIVTVDFETLTEGTPVSSPLTLNGFVFTDASDPQFEVFGPGNGYDSIVVLNDNSSSQIVVTKDGGGSFNLESFDYSAAPWNSNVTDADVTGTFSDGSTQTVSYSTTTRAGQTLVLNWTDLTEVTIDFAAGANGRWGGVDKFVFD